MAIAERKNMTDENTTVSGEIVDERTGEVIPKGATKEIALASNQNTQIDIHRLGTLEVSSTAEKVLGTPLNPYDVKIRPDGLVYLPWTWYADRLNQAFGRLQWALMPQGAPGVKEIDPKNVLIIWGNWLVVKGIPIGFAIGETTYRPSNKTMSYGDACEGAKSISLARNCKILGMALELWDGEWCEEWKNKYARKIRNPNGDYPEYIWVKNDDKRYPRTNVKKVAKEAASEAGNYGNENQDGKNLQELDVDRDFPKDGAVAEAKSLSEHGEKPMTKKQFLGDFHLIKEIARATDKKDSEVAKYIGSLDDGKYTVSQIIGALKPAENVEQTGDENVAQ